MQATLDVLWQQYNGQVNKQLSFFKNVNKQLSFFSANLMEVMMEFDVKKIVFSSSATVYGDPKYLPVDEKHSTGNCTNPYGKTKFFMEEIIKDQITANPVIFKISIKL